MVLPVVCLASEERRKAGNIHSQCSDVASVVMWSLCGIAIGSYVCECVYILSASWHLAAQGKCSRVSFLRDGMLEQIMLQVRSYPCGFFQTFLEAILESFWLDLGVL